MLMVWSSIHDFFTPGRLDCQLVAWRGGNMSCPINKVALYRAELVLGWVTICGLLNHHGM